MLNVIEYILSHLKSDVKRDLGIQMPDILTAEKNSWYDANRISFVTARECYKKKYY